MNSNKSIYTPYTYLIGWSKLNKWYYGVRYARKHACLYESGCHPDDFWVTYFTSSKEVKKLIQEFGNPDIKQIRKVFTTSESAQAWEVKVLQRLPLEEDTWINKHVCGAIIYSPEVRKRIGRNSKSLTGKPKTEEHRRNISKGRTGIKFSDSHRANIKASRKNQIYTEEHRNRIGESSKGTKWWNNGERNSRSKECPGSEWKPGRLSWKSA